MIITQKKSLLVYGLLSFAVIGAVLFFVRGSLQNAELSPSPSDIVQTTATPTPVVGGAVKPGGQAGNILGSSDYAKFTGPATCMVGGSIKFLDQSTAINEGAALRYAGIDSPARQVYWTSSPSNPGIAIGPNIAASLKLPNGDNQITVVLPSNLTAKQYTLTAAMTYGRLVDGGIKVYTAKCSGSVDLQTDF